MRGPYDGHCTPCRFSYGTSDCRDAPTCKGRYFEEVPLEELPPKDQD